MSETLTAEKAIRLLGGFVTEEVSQKNDALIWAQAELTKEIPQAPLKRKRVGPRAIEQIFRCPCPGCDEACGHVFTADEVSRKVRRCPECGQRIDWEAGSDDNTDD